MKKYSLLVLTIILSLLLCLACHRGKKDALKNEEVIDFGKVNKIKSSDLLSIYRYICLETSADCLLGSINQIEICDNKIYILDNSNTNSVYVFSMDGRFEAKLSNGSAPDEFIAPHSFWIHNKEFIFILDRAQNKIYKYKLNNLEFVGNVIPPVPAPLSFAVLPVHDTFLYYYPQRNNNSLENKLFIYSDAQGNIINKVYEATLSSKILHGNSSNFYSLNGVIRGYPYFSNEIFEFNNDSLNQCYSLYWGDYFFPDKEVFAKYTNSGDIMKDILTGDKDWIRLLYVYETEDLLVVKYYIKKDFYISVCDKKTKKVVNTKHKEIIDDLGIGDFPLPIGISEQLFIGQISPILLDRTRLKDTHLLDLLGEDEEANPILVLCKLNVNAY